MVVAKSHIVYWVIILILGGLLWFYASRPEKVVEKVTTKTETITKEVHDTTFIEVPKIVEVHTKDTIYVPQEDGSKLPLVYAKTRYSEPNLYDVWVEGYNATLSSIMVFPKTVYETITNTIEKEVEIRRWSAYGGIVFEAIGGTYVPKIGVYVTSPRKWLFGANFGYLRGNCYVGATIAYKFTR